MIDVRAFYSQYVRVVGRPSTSRSDGKEYHGSCPWCGGTDRFAFWDSGRYSCSIRASGCGHEGGDMLHFLREYLGLSFFEACEELGVDPGSKYVRSFHPLPSEDGPPSGKWQERAAAVLHRGQLLLWSDRGRGALDYLRARGLTEETIRLARLGYIPPTSEGRWYRDQQEQWGLSAEEDADPCVWLPEGILIPWFADGALWKLQVRRLTGWEEGHARYVQIRGSQEGLYNVDAIRVGTPLVLVEGEFDALSGQQACPDLAAYVATGATTRGRRDRWIARMGLASCVLVAFDSDPAAQIGKGAGEEGAGYWVRVLPHALRWVPWAHDLNEMLVQGQDVRAWVVLGRATAEAVKSALRGETPSANEREGDPSSIDSRCGARVESDGAQGGAFWTGDGQERDDRDALPSEAEAMRGRLPGLPTDGGILSLPLSTPGILPALPRALCPFELAVVGNDQRVRAVECRGKAQANGWCETHQHAQELLCLGATLGYPRIEFPAYRAIGEGKGCWEAYARRAPASQVRQDLPRIQKMVKRVHPSRREGPPPAS